MTSFEGLLKSAARGPLAYLTLFLLMAPPVLAESASALDIGERRQVFIDHRFLESSQGVRLRVHPPQKTGEMTIAQEHPWESRRVGLYGTVLKLGETYHMWYESLRNLLGRPNPKVRRLCETERSGARPTPDQRPQ